MIAGRAAGSKYLPTELPQKPNWPTEPIICRRSQIFADGAKYLPTELPRSQICRRSNMIADRAAGAKYLPTEPPQKQILLTEPQICRRSYRKSKFADGASYMPTEPHICRRSYRKSQICRRSHIFSNGAAGAKYLPTIICRQSRRSQIFADRATPGAKFVVGASGAKFAIIPCCMFYCLSIFLTIFALLSLSCRPPKIDTIQSKLVFCTQPKQNLSFRRTSSQLQFPHSN
jgi:hypothetical protein